MTIIETPRKKREDFDVANLNEMQRYFGEETIDEYREGAYSRRRMLRRLILICGSTSAAAALLAACGDSTTAAPVGTTAGSSPAAGTASSGGAVPGATTSSVQPTTVAVNTTGTATTPAATTAASTTASATTAANATTTASGTTASGTTATSTTASGTTAAGSGQKAVLAVTETDPNVTASDVTFQGDTQIFGYLAKPKGAGPFPGVIVIHENRGLTDHIKDVARRLAVKGYIALAPDLASRNGGTAKVASDQVTAYFSQAKPDDLVKDLNTSVDFLEKQSGVKTGKYGVVGFCYGGGMSLRLAAANSKIAAAVPYYGPIPDPADPISKTSAAILAQYGGNDSRVNARIPELEKAMAGKTFEKKIYDGANHAFNNDTGASYNEKAAVEAWTATIAWFDKYIKA